ncbi:MAG: 4-(cytidine 5'-diphospho)-2-C-methyl-D-erythritol kinase [Bacteroidales bacterium]|nr:4-(cytidine 5'-diphospho)-2-C-methyl-D-erythritol kinase [Bacteroidales bacterium]
MLVFPNAKINIGLNITEKRPDGFHNLESVFYPINLSDILEFVTSEKKINFTNSGLQIGVSDNDNLVLKAYYLLKKDFKLPELNIHLHKIIPFGAGLGGGSSDAAFMLKALNQYFELNISEYKLQFYAQKLGSDCPFFITNKPVFAEGTGNIFTNIDLDLSSYYILLVKPNIHISTKDAFSEIKPKKPKISLKEIIKLPVKQWRELIKNNFEEPVFKMHPEIKNIKETLYNRGAVYAQMSGTGSTVYGIFEKKPENFKEFENYFTFQDKL